MQQTRMKLSHQLASMNHKLKKGIPILIAVFLAVIPMLFIFSNSLLTADQSRAISLQAMAYIAPLEGEGYDLGLLHHYLRKFGHIAEFALLSVVLYTGMNFLGKWSKHSVLLLLYIGLFVAVTDEYMQSFIPGRGPMVSDVVLDHIGFILGLCGSMLVHRLMSIIRYRSKS